MTNYIKLINTLKEVFMLDKAELDFGIYRIMNQKRKDIEQFLEVDLVPQVQEILKSSQALDAEGIKKQLDAEIETARKYGNANPEELQQVKELQAQYQRAGDLTAIENEVFSLLANFFKRYFDNGDFISMRRYKKDVYAIPYEGEEVKLHWANADQYYIKTSEYFKVYRFKLANGKTVCFELVEASTEQNNNKTQGDRERRFALSNEELKIKNDELVIPFTYEPTDKKVKQADLLKEAFEKVKPQIASKFSAFIDLLAKDQKYSGKEARTVLEKHLNDYTARNTFDYFIHKDLGGFLTRELDFYIKNEVLFIDDLNTRDEKEFLKQLSKIKAIKKIGEKIIAFLAQLENFQKKLWLKKKMVVECNYCVTLDRVPKDLYPEIIKNAEVRIKNYNGKSKNGEGWSQLDEWIDLFAIDEIKGNEEVRSKNEELKQEELKFEFAEPQIAYRYKKVGFSNPLTLEFLNQNQFLVLDTAFFSEIFKWKLIGSIEKFDEQCDGLLINSENFQALNTIKKRFEEQVDCVYVDPPYNAKSSEIVYKNTFKHSSFNSFIHNRVEQSFQMLSEAAFFQFAIDDYELKNTLPILEQIFGEENFVANITVVHNPRGRNDDKFYGTCHEYMTVYSKNKSKSTLGLFELSEKDVLAYNKSDGVSNFSTVSYMRTGNNSKRFERPNLYYPIYIEPKSLAISLEKQDGFIEVLPLGPTGEERTWRWGKDTFLEKHKTEIDIRLVSNEYKIFKKRRLEGAGKKPKTVWNEPKYDASSHGIMLLRNLFGEDSFSYPKSINTVTDALFITTHEDSLVLDYFAGSGTTGHAVINLNREDEGQRKYILIEMGTYFDTVTKPRIQKVVYSKDWKEGKPVSREGISHCFKYMRLESYEDTLNNLALKQTETQQQALAMNPTFKEGYMLNYMLDVEAAGSLLNLEWFVNPFNYYLNITKNNELQPTKVDLVETFNYLIGLVVESYAVPKDGYVVVTGKNLAGESILVVWRDCTQHNSTALNQFLEKSKYNPLDTEYDRIYVNGDNNVENLKTGDERWKVVLIEEEFGKRMFEGS